MADKALNDLTDDDINLILENRANEQRLLSAKEAYRANPDDADAEAEYRDAKDAVRQHREHWRTVRKYVMDTEREAGVIHSGVAEPDTFAGGSVVQSPEGTAPSAGEVA